jgi:hypothetical protein
MAKHRDPSWAGPLRRTVIELIGRLIELLTREADGGSILAGRLNALGFLATTLQVLNSHRSR